MAAPIEDHTWYEFLSILAWVVADAEEARNTLGQAAQNLDRAAMEAQHLAAIAHGASYATVMCSLRRDAHAGLNRDRDRVTDLGREDPAAGVEPGAFRRPNCGILVNVRRGIEVLLGTEPSEQAMHSFTLRWEADGDRHVWYPGWLADVKREVEHALRSLARALSQLEHVHPDMADYLAVSTSPEGAATAVEACTSTAERCATAAQHARQAAANMGVVINTLGQLRDELLDQPPTSRVIYFFGFDDAGAAAGAAAAGDDAAAGD